MFTIHWEEVVYFLGTIIFFILYLESYISRLNEILRHDLTLSVGEPDNAAAKQGQELRSV